VREELWVSIARWVNNQRTRQLPELHMNVPDLQRNVCPPQCLKLCISAGVWSSISVDGECSTTDGVDALAEVLTHLAAAHGRPVPYVGIDVTETIIREWRTGTELAECSVWVRDAIRKAGIRSCAGILGTQEDGCHWVAWKAWTPKDGVFFFSIYDSMKGDRKRGFDQVESIEGKVCDMCELSGLTAPQTGPAAWEVVAGVDCRELRVGEYLRGDSHDTMGRYKTIASWFALAFGNRPNSEVFIGIYGSHQQHMDLWSCGRWAVVNLAYAMGLSSWKDGWKDQVRLLRHAMTLLPTDTPCSNPIPRAKLPGRRRLHELAMQ